MGSSSVTATDGMALRTVIWAGNLWIYINNNPIWFGTVPTTTGKPGIGGHGIPAGSGFISIDLGPHDTVAPAAVDSTQISSSVFPTSAALSFPGVPDDASGVGLFLYNLLRNGSIVANSYKPEFVDETVVPSTTYTYTIQAVDWHGNLSQTNFTLSTPPAGSIDPRRIGLYSTGTYWGGGGEQIDTLSGNLHFSIPLASAQGRTGWTVPVNLVYDSQNWRQDNGVNWKLGSDVGYGFGWRALIGSITPYYAQSWGGVGFYVYTDATGAEYRLDQNSGGVWSTTTQAAHVWLDTTVSPNKLHFPDGKFWVMGSTSGGTEADAGTMYPTIIEDTFGNQVIVTYDTGAGLPFRENPLPPSIPYWTVTQNTSSRIVSIEDTRAQVCTLIYFAYPNFPCGAYATGSTIGYTTFVFAYDHVNYAVPHLISYRNLLGVTGSGYNITYTTGAQSPPFGTDPRYSGETATFLSQAAIGASAPYQFGYDTAGAGELTSVIFPFGGKQSWSYGTFAYVGNRSLREVSARYLAPDSAHATSPPWTYGISRPDAPNSVIVHSAMTLTDASGVGAKTWNFHNSGALWQLGLVSEFVQRASAGGTILQDDTYTWTQDAAGHPYMSAKSSATGQGTSNPVTAYSTQTMDQYGNVTQSVIYPYNNTTTPLRTYNNIYSTSYPAKYTFNLLATTNLIIGAGTPPGIQLVSNTYDGAPCVTAPDGASVCGGTVPPYPSTNVPAHEYDSLLGHWGALTASVTNAHATGIASYPWGMVYTAMHDDGTQSTASADAGTNFAAPISLSAQGYNETVGYTAWLGVAQTTGANGEQLAMTYDGFGRPLKATSPYGAVTNYTYATSAPFWQTETGPNGVTTTTLDGFGRAVRVAQGDSSGVKSYTDSTYAPCACSPLGKLQKVSQPYPSGSSASAWTAYIYDGLGRTLSVQQPDGSSTTHYAYAGNQTTVTDPAAFWKIFLNDELGNLTVVVEPDPDPLHPSGTLDTTYTYDWMNHVSCVDMDRGGTLTALYTYISNGVSCTSLYVSGTRQTRTFVYNNAGQLTSASNPENGTVTYTYNTGPGGNGLGKLKDKHDAKGQDTVYTYDSLSRVIEVQRKTGGFEDVCARVTYTYDTNAVNPAFSQSSTGRLTTVQYAVLNAQGRTYGCNGYGLQEEDIYTEMYSYHPAGAVTAKNVQMQRQLYDPSLNPYTATGSMEVDYTYDTAGRTLTVSNPAGGSYGYDGSSNPVYYPNLFTYGYDTMGRPSSLSGGFGPLMQPGAGGSWVSNVQYDYAGRLTGMKYPSGSVPSGGGGYTTTYYQETLSYNVSGQLASLSWPWPGLGGGIQYVYSATQNNGQITQAVDTISGETITYGYDSLKRLVLASAVPISGGTPAAWTQTYQYDGFGNLTGEVLNGSSNPIAVTATTNHLTNALYDLNGNMTSGTGLTLAYDEANRLSAATKPGGGANYYGYGPDNKRIYVNTNGPEQWIFYGAKGEKLGTFNFIAPLWSAGSHQFTFAPQAPSVWFAGKLIWDAGQPVAQDRVGTNRVTSARFRPYGDEITSTASDHVKFGTYTRDSYTGLDYADQRFYASTYGRFNTPDPYQASGGPGDPGSWNRYSYTRGDPINRADPRGLEDCDSAYALIEGCTGDPNDYCGFNADAGCIGASSSPAGGSICNDDPTILAFTDPGSYAACFGGASIIPVGGPVQPAAPTCSLDVQSFSLNTVGGGPDLHGSLYFTSTQYGGFEDVIEGYTDESNLLKAAVDPGNVGPVGNVAGTGTDDGAISGPQVCSALGILESDASKINGAGIRYGLLGPNSSSALRYMLQSLSSLLGSSWYSIPTSMLFTGYNARLPGLESPPRRPAFPRR